MIRIDPAVLNGTRTVDVKLDGPLPPGAVPQLSVEGTIEIERLADVLYVGRPVHGDANSTVGLFKLVDGGKEAVRVQVELGRDSVNAVEIRKGLQVGDQVILSDMSAYGQLRSRAIEIRIGTFTDSNHLIRIRNRRSENMNSRRGSVDSPGRRDESFYTDEVETHALSGVHLEIKNGEFLSIAGPSGCGKSTLLSILGLLDSPTEGNYWIQPSLWQKLSLATARASAIARSASSSRRSI